MLEDEVFHCWKKVFENDLPSLAQELEALLEKPCVLFLTGKMGAGKTTFTRYFNKQVTPVFKADALSPTYSIINEVGSLVHADFYRLKNEDELVELELSLYLEHKDFFVIEWGIPYLEQVKNIVGDDFTYYEIEIEANESNSRNYYLKNYC